MSNRPTQFEIYNIKKNDCFLQKSKSKNVSEKGLKFPIISKIIILIDLTPFHNTQIKECMLKRVGPVGGGFTRTLSSALRVSSCARNSHQIFLSMHDVIACVYIVFNSHEHCFLVRCTQSLVVALRTKF